MLNLFKNYVIGIINDTVENEGLLDFEATVDKNKIQVLSSFAATSVMTEIKAGTIPTTSEDGSGGYKHYLFKLELDPNKISEQIPRIKEGLVSRFVMVQRYDYALSAEIIIFDIIEDKTITLVLEMNDDETYSVNKIFVSDDENHKYPSLTLLTFLKTINKTVI